MAGPSAYVHSDIDHADLSMSVELVDQMNGVNTDDGLSYVQSTINKLEIIASQLESAANQFLEGIPLDAAQAIADNAGNSLIHLANSVLYGPLAYEMTSDLMVDQTVKLRELLSSGDFSGKYGKEIYTIIDNAIRSEMPMTIQTLGKLIVQEIVGKDTEIDVTEAGTVFVTLGSIFQLKSFETVERKVRNVEVNAVYNTVNKNRVSTNYKNSFRRMMLDLFRSSNFVNTSKLEATVDKFCNRLRKEMIIEAERQIKFMWTSNPNEIETTINNFIEKLKPDLLTTLNKNKLTNISNAVGEIGEPVRESISRTANSVIMSFQIGDLDDKSGIDKVNQELSKLGNNNKLTQMISYHEDGKQSQTDLILLNTKTKQIARAQSKNHFNSYFTKGTNTNNEQIENFRWSVEKGANLFSFISNLSNTELGINLNSFDLSNILKAIANNIWFNNHNSVTGAGYATLKSEPVSTEDFVKNFEGAMEKLLAGQVTNLLGVTIRPAQNIQIDPNASNIFYVLNGRLKQTADLVREAKNQIEMNEVKKIGQAADRSRLVNVTIQTGVAKGSSKSFLVSKFHAEGGSAESIGEEMGSNILNNIKINVSLGTSIAAIQKSALIV